MPQSSRPTDDSRHSIAAIILAAGASSRMGTPKQLLKFRGQTFVRRAVCTAAAAGLDPIILVTGAGAGCLVEEVSGLRVELRHNSGWERGIGSSIRCGVQGISAGIEAVVILLCDQPFLSKEYLAKLVQTYRASGVPVVASEYENTVGVPVVFSHLCFDRLVKLTDGAGAKSVIREMGDIVRTVPFPEGALDIDEPADYEGLFPLNTQDLSVANALSP